MNTQDSLILLAAAVALLGFGTFLLLPHRHGKVRPRVWHYVGAGASALGVLLVAGLWVAPANILAAFFFYGFGLIAMGGGVLMISSMNPVHSALWFAMVVLSTSGLFLLAGAQFLAAGTIIVYAGAIIVTFLFVIMLAQAEGQALYDRLARSPGRSALVAFLLLAGVLYAVELVKSAPAANLVLNEDETPTIRDQDQLRRPADYARRVEDSLDPHLQAVYARVQSPRSLMVEESSLAATNGFPPPHVAGLGATLFTDHLVSVEVAGAILFVALVGAACIATPKPPIRPQVPPSTTPQA